MELCKVQSSSDSIFVFLVWVDIGMKTKLLPEACSAAEETKYIWVQGLNSRQAIYRWYKLKL